MLANRASSTPKSAAPSRRPSLRIRAGANGTAPELAEGAIVKVVKPVKVYHVPKHTAGIDLEGLTGTFVKDVTQYKGSTLSANLPVKVAFLVERDGATLKFQAHLASDEVQAV